MRRPFVPTTLLSVLLSAPALAQSANPVCVLGDHNGVADPDADTTAELVCDAIRDEGVAVDGPVTEPGDAGTRYVITIRRLGETYILELAEQDGLGRQVDERSLQLSGIEEVPIAAPRLAHALLKDLPVEQTSSVSTLVGEESREYEPRHGEFLVGFGIGGLFIPGAPVTGEPGMAFLSMFEAPRYAAGLDMRFGIGGDDSGDAGYMGIGVGGRYFFSERNLAPYAGGGLSWDLAAISETESTAEGGEVTRSWEGSGLAAFLQGGIEFLREYRSRLIMDLRVDAPFFQLEANSSDNPDGDSRFVLPVTLSLSYAWTPRRWSWF